MTTMTQLRRPPPSQTNPFALAESVEVERKAARPTHRRRRSPSGGADRAKHIRVSSWSWIWTMSHEIILFFVLCVTFSPFERS